MAKFNVGDVVQLASGGEKMTVSYVYDSTATGLLTMVYQKLKMTYPDSEVFYACTWFKGKEFQNNTFREEVFVKVDE